VEDIEMGRKSSKEMYEIQRSFFLPYFSYGIYHFCLFLVLGKFMFLLVITNKKYIQTFIFNFYLIRKSKNEKNIKIVNLFFLLKLFILFIRRKCLYKILIFFHTNRII